MKIKMTPALSHMMAHVNTPDQKESLQGYLAEAIQQLNQQQPTLNEIQKMVDQFCGPNEAQATCSKGCNACCSFPVSVSGEEARMVVEYVRENKIPVDQKKLKILALTEQKDWFMRGQQERTCVFNGPDGACRIYEVRPLVCRKVLMASDLKLCSETNEAGVLQRKELTSVAAEILISAYFTVSTTFGLLPEMIWDLMQK